MKVLIINTVPFRNNGMSAIILDYYKQLKNDFQFDFVINEFLEEHFLRRIGYDSKLFFLPNRKKKLPKYIIELRRIVKENDYDLIHIHGNSSLMAIELFACSRMLDTKKIVHCHGSQSDYGMLEKLTRNYFFKNYDKAITVELEKSYLFSGKQHEVLLNGIEVEKFKFSLKNRNEIRKMFGLKNEKILLHIGRMNRQKNQSFLLKVFKEYLKINPQSCLFLIGDGPLKEDIKKEIKFLNLEKQVKLIGLVSNAEEWYSAADIFLLPSTFEPFGLVAVEAQVNGLPCVFSENVSEQVQVSNEVSFLPINSDNIPKWSEKITQVTSRQRPKYQNETDERLFKYDIKQAAKRLKKIYFESFND